MMHICPNCHYKNRIRIGSNSESTQVVNNEFIEKNIVIKIDQTINSIQLTNERSRKIINALMTPLPRETRHSWQRQHLAETGETFLEARKKFGSGGEG